MAAAVARGEGFAKALGGFLNGEWIASPRPQGERPYISIVLRQVAIDLRAAKVI
jgi:hypothetical protein